MSDEMTETNEDLGAYAPTLMDHSARRAEIEQVMRTDMAAYRAGGMDHELTRLLREEQGDLPACEPMQAADSRSMMLTTDTGRSLVNEWNAQGGFEQVLQRVQGSVGGLVQGMGDDRAQRAFMARFDREIPEDVRYQIYSELALGPSTFVPSATPEQIQVFRQGGPLGDELIAEWGPRAPEKVSQIFNRSNRLRASIGDDAMASFLGWFNSLNDRQMRRVLQFIAS